jgi:hypothetical protein
LALADLNAALVVFTSLVLNTGPFPEVLGAGRVMPFSRMQATNFVSAALPSALLKRPPPKPPPPLPHFFSASWSWVRLVPFGSWKLPPRPGPPPGRPGAAPAGGRFPDGAGSVMPCFARQDLNAVNRPDPDACALFGAAPALEVVVLVELLAELPHAASARLAASTDSATAARVRRVFVGLKKRGGCMVSVVPCLVF